jgi:hypothetical protein
VEPVRPVSLTYLPGGAAVLPLIARAPALGLLEDPTQGSMVRSILERPAALHVLVAPHAEDVQDWLEQVQPLTAVPAVAVTGAGADPLLRPYLDSGQLRGLTSGFDGAYHYTQLLEPFAPASSPAWLAVQQTLQNWGHWAVITLIALGNLAAMVGRDED